MLACLTKYFTYKINPKVRALTLKGRISFHAVIMSMSHRTRGNEQRTQMNTILIIIVFNRITLAPRNSMVVINLNKRIIPYSLMKMKANKPAPYSTLNPDTSSDSPSERSKGVRFDSAIQSNIHVRSKGSLATPNQ